MKEDNSMLIDLHAHTRGISICCQGEAETIIRDTKNAGVDGIVLTNHYQSYYVQDGNAKAFAQRYIDEYYLTKEIGDKLGVKVFWGIEVTMDFDTNVHLLIYGVGTEITKDYPELYACSQKELYEIVKSYGGALVQGHPFRVRDEVIDTNYLDGIEINCHPKQRGSFVKEIIEIAKEDGLALTCGGDYHADAYRPKCGMYLPESIKNEKDLGDYILNASTVKLSIEETHTRDLFDYEYTRTYKNKNNN